MHTRGEVVHRPAALPELIFFAAGCGGDVLLRNRLDEARANESVTLTAAKPPDGWQSPVVREQELVPVYFPTAGAGRAATEWR